MVTHSPLSYPGVNDYGVGIPINAEVFVDVDPQVTIANKRTLESIDVVHNFTDTIQSCIVDMAELFCTLLT